LIPDCQHEASNLIGIVFVGSQSDNFELVGITLLQINKVRNFSAARSAPGRPEIQQHDFAFSLGSETGLPFRSFN